MTCGWCVAASRLRKGPRSPLPPCLPSLLQPPGSGHRQKPLPPAPAQGWVWRRGYLAEPHPPTIWCSGEGGLGKAALPRWDQPHSLSGPCLWLAAPSYTPSASQLCLQDLPHPCPGPSPAQALSWPIALPLPPLPCRWAGRCCLILEQRRGSLGPLLPAGALHSWVPPDRVYPFIGFGEVLDGISFVFLSPCSPFSHLELYQSFLGCLRMTLVFLSSLPFPSLCLVFCFLGDLLIFQHCY